MPDKKHVETLLRINGYSASASDDEIKSVLVSARYTEKDVETAIMMLRGKFVDGKNKDRKEELNKVFRTNQGLKPHEISKLLNIEIPINLSADEVGKDSVSSKKALQGMVVTATIIVGLASILLLIAMYHYKIGLFHPIAGAFH